MILTLGSFFAALFFLVVFHELGHFSVARFFGVKVLQFSFGFGRKICSFKDKSGTEYVWGWLPLGGFVRMLDEHEGPVSPNELPHAFNRQPVGIRFLIVLAGPLFNFILAFFLMWVVAMMGVQSLAPIVENVTQQSAADKAGLQKNDEIISVNGEKVIGWQDVQYRFISFLGVDTPVTLTVQNLKTQQQRHLNLSLLHWDLNANTTDPLLALGIQIFTPAIPPVVGEVMPDSPASKAGLVVGDKILQYDNKKVDDWMDLVMFFRNHPNETVSLSILRDGKRVIIPVKIAPQTVGGVIQGYIGIRSQKMDWPPNWLRTERYSPLEALPVAFTKTKFFISTTFGMMTQLFTGKLGLDNVSGPIGIARNAGESLRSGFVYYLMFLAMISISLGLLNLFPIPLLDGGHLLYYLCEIILRRPLSSRIVYFGNMTGLFVLLGLIILALKNDLLKLFTFSG